MKKGFALVLALLCVLSLAGCSKAVTNPGGRSYTYQNEGYGGSFVIILKDDGTYTYVEGWNGPYTGVGDWTMENDIITMKEDEFIGRPRLNRFRFTGKNLIFIQEGSTNFTYIQVKDGELFHGAPLEE